MEINKNLATGALPKPEISDVLKSYSNVEAKNGTSNKAAKLEESGLQKVVLEAVEDTLKSAELLREENALLDEYTKLQSSMRPEDVERRKEIEQRFLEMGDEKAQLWGESPCEKGAGSADDISPIANAGPDIADDSANEGAGSVDDSSPIVHTKAGNADDDSNPINEGVIANDFTQFYGK